jgi:hypothetical protein
MCMFNAVDHSSIHREILAAIYTKSISICLTVLHINTLYYPEYFRCIYT